MLWKAIHQKRLGCVRGRRDNTGGYTSDQTPELVDKDIEIFDYYNRQNDAENQ